MRVFVCSSSELDPVDGLQESDAMLFLTSGMRKIWRGRWGSLSASVFSDDMTAGVVELDDGRVVLWAGYIGQSDAEAHFRRALKVEQGRITLAQPSGGIASFALIDPVCQAVYGWSTQPGVEPVYYSIGRMSNKPRGAFGPGEPRFNFSFLDWYLPVGYSLDGSTPYEGVRGLGANECVVLSGSEARIEKHPNPDVADKRDLDLITMSRQGADVLSDAVSPLKSFRQVELFLSNGKDSRLLAAALKASGINATATTMVMSDVSVLNLASQVAERAGFELAGRYSPFKAGAVHSTLVETLQRSCGILNCEANVDMVPWPLGYEQGQAIVFGHSHLQKGGLIRARIPSEVEALAIAQRRVCENPLVTQELVSRASDYLASWFASRDFLDPTDALFWVAHDFRVTQYLRAHYHRFSTYGMPVYPLIDERFARFCGATDMMTKVDESFMFLMIAAMCSGMRDLPTAKVRWKFEAHGLSDVCPTGYESRAAVPVDEPETDPYESIWNSSALIGHVRDVVLGGRLRDELFSRTSQPMRNAIINWQGGRFFPGAPRKRSAYIQLYRMYAATVLSDEVFRS